MAPKKKKDDKKKGGEDDEKGPLEAKNFKKAFPIACQERHLEVYPLTLDQGEEGLAPFLRLAICRGLPGTVAFVPQHVSALVECLLPYSYLQRLVMWSVAVQDEGCKMLMPYIVNNKTVTALELTDCNIGPLGCKHLGEALARNTTLQTLRLDHNRGIGPAGSAVLGETLKSNVGVQTLSLTFCGIEGDAGAESIVTGNLMNAPMLKVLELKGNRFGETGLVKLLKVHLHSSCRRCRRHCLHAALTVVYAARRLLRRVPACSALI